MSKKDEPRWFQEGLKFECSQCGDCCTGSPGYVWLNAAEIKGLAARLNLSIELFEKKYVRRVGIRKSLVEYENGDCVLFDTDTRKCTVYEDRPRQCRTWPFWHSTTKTPEAWNETCQECPGCGQGPLVPTEQILKSIKVLRL